MIAGYNVVLATEYRPEPAKGYVVSTTTDIVFPSVTCVRFSPTDAGRGTRPRNTVSFASTDRTKFAVKIVRGPATNKTEVVSSDVGFATTDRRGFSVGFVRVAAADRGAFECGFVFFVHLP